MKTEVTVDAIEEQLTLDQAKTHLRVYTSDEDSYLESLIITARKIAELETRNYYGEQTVKLSFFKEDEIGTRIELAHPHVAITSAKTIFNGVETDITDYSVRDDCLFFDQVPEHDSIEIVQTVGKEAPHPIKAAMLLLIGHLYENREAITDIEDLKMIPFGIDRLFGFDRVVL